MTAAASSGCRRWSDGYAVEGGKGMSKAVMISIRPKWCEKMDGGDNDAAD